MKQLFGTRTRWLSLAALLSLGSGPALADDNLQPIPFKATMEVTRGSLTFATGEITMQQADDGHWVQSGQATAQGIAVLMQSGTLEEDSHFHWHDGQMITDRYEMRLRDKKMTMRGRKEITEVVRSAQFDWNSNQAELFKEGETATVEVEPGTTSAQLMPIAVMQTLRRDGLPAEGEMLAINFVDKLKARTYKFFVKGREKLSTPFGEFDCVILERDSGKRITRLWVAPELDYFGLRLDKEKKGGEPIVTRMLTLERNGKPVGASQ